MGTGFKWYGQRGGGPVQMFVEAGVPPQMLHSYLARQWFDDEAVAWAKEGIDGAEAPVWKALGLRPNEAGRLIRQGAMLADTIRDWWRAGIPIDEFADWIAAGLTPKEAAGQRSGRHVATLRAMDGGPGSSPGQNVEAGAPSQMLHSHLARRWFDDEAVAWAKEGIDRAEAPVWKALALRPNEAGRLVRQGAMLADTIRDWWRAGIPMDEFADWIGAGLTPKEAAAQRAKGVTAERAAALRALRDDPFL